MKIIPNFYYIINSQSMAQSLYDKEQCIFLSTGTVIFVKELLLNGLIFSGEYGNWRLNYIPNLTFATYLNLKEIVK